MKRQFKLTRTNTDILPVLCGNPQEFQKMAIVLMTHGFRWPEACVWLSFKGKEGIRLNEPLDLSTNQKNKLRIIRRLKVKKLCKS